MPLVLLIAGALYFSGLFGSEIPDLNLERIDGRTFTKENLQENVPLVLLYVDVTCNDCNGMMKAILDREADFKNTQILVVSPQSLTAMRSFYNVHELRKYPFITPLIDRIRDFDKRIKAQTFPTTIVYNRNGRIVKRFDGAAPIEEIVKALF